MESSPSATNPASELGEVDQRAALGQLTCPILSCVGAQDALVDPEICQAAQFNSHTTVKESRCLDTLLRWRNLCNTTWQFRFWRLRWITTALIPHTAQGAWLKTGRKHPDYWPQIGSRQPLP